MNLRHPVDKESVDDLAKDAIERVREKEDDFIKKALERERKTER